MAVVTDISPKAEEALHRLNVRFSFGNGNAYRFEGLPGQSSVDIMSAFTLGDTSFVIEGERLLLAEEQQSSGHDLITGEYDALMLSTGLFVRFHTTTNPLDLFESAVRLFRYRWPAEQANRFPYMVCLSEEHRAALQQALALGVSPQGRAGEGSEQQFVQIGYRYELDAHSVIVQAEKRPRQRQEQ